MDNIKVYTEGNRDDLNEAISCLDRFAKNFCMNVKKTKEKGDLVFNCDGCEFETVDEICLVKRFVKNRAKEAGYNFGNFGSMASGKRSKYYEETHKLHSVKNV